MLDINPVAVLTQAIAFILLWLFMARVVVPRIDAVLEGRQREIQETLEQIAEDRRAMEQTRADYERRLAQFEAEARERMNEHMKLAQQEAAALLARAREEAAAIRERALADIDQERKKAIAQIRSEMADLAVLAASKILEREINPAVHRDLVRSVIDQVGTPS